MQRLQSVLFLSFCALLLTFSPARGQAISGDISGTVTDPSGAVVSNATVTAVEIATNVTSVTKSHDDGGYRLQNLLPGNYKLTAAAPGFSKYVLNNLAVVLNQTTTANLSLNLNTASTSVNVSDAAAAIDTTSAQLQSTYTGRQISDLPNTGIGWGPLNLALLSAGVASSGGVGVGTGPSVGGQRPRNNNFTVDGVDNNDKSSTGPTLYLPNESTAQFTVLQNQFQAEFGHSSGGQFNAIVKSGTNDFHGELYEYLLNRNLNAVDQLFANQGTTANPRYDQSHLGVTFGGPVVRNKLFFFTSFEYNPTGQASSSGLVYAPTAAGYDQLAATSGVNQTNLNVMRKYITASTISPGAPVIQIGNTAVATGIVPEIAPSYVNAYYGVASVDYNISDHDQLRGRFINNRSDSIDTSALLSSFYTNQAFRSYLATLAEYHTFSPRVLNELRLAYQRQNQEQPSGNFSFPGLDAFPNLVFYDLNLQLGPDPQAPQTVRNNLYQVIDNVSVTAGAHSFKFGTEFRDAISPTQFSQRVRGDYDYSSVSNYLLDLTPDISGLRTLGSPVYYGNQLATYSFAQDTWRVRPNLTLDLGLRYEYTTVPLGMQQQQLNAIASVPGLIDFRAPRADSHAIAPRIGLAWSPGTTGNTVFRAGFSTAYDQIFDNIGLLVLPPQFSTAATVNLGSGSNFLSNGGITEAAIPAVTDAASARARTSSYIPDQKLPYAVNYTFEVQHVFARDYTLSVRYLGTRGVHLLQQQQLNRRALVSSSAYIPTYSTAPSLSTLQALPYTVGQLRAPGSLTPAFANAGFTNSILSFQPQGFSNYNGLATQLNRRFSNGLQGQLAYTWSHNIDNSTAEVGSTFLTPRRAQDFANLSAEKASSALDRRHRISLSLIYDAPWWKSSTNWWRKNLAGNWEIAPTYTYESPQYFTVQSLVDANLNNDSVGDRTIVNPSGAAGTGSAVYGLDRNGNVIAPTNTRRVNSIVAYVAANPNARYIQAGAGALTTGGRNTEPSRPIDNVDLSLTKHFEWRERMRIDIGARAVNVFNHAQFIPGSLNDVGPIATANSGVQGFVSAGSPYFNQPELAFSSNPRYLQLLARIIW